MDNLQKALEYTLENEGGFSNDSHDYGGATRFGITRDDASRWRGRDVSVDEMKEFPLEDAKDIYREWYWKPIGCDRIQDAGIATCMFDIGVLCGTGTAAIFAQEICNRHGASLAIDGAIGPLSLEAINNLSAKEFVPDFSAMAEERFRNIVASNPSQDVFLQGWLNRAHRLLTLIND